MKARLKLLLALSLTTSLTATAIAGERTGTWEDTPLKGASICQFSGLNDDPTGIDPDNGPPGRTQSFGQDIANWGGDPRDEVFQPGNLCNPNNLPWKDIGGDTN